MKIGGKLLKKLKKTYAPSSLIDFTFERYDAAMKTDEAGHPILLFIGKKGEDGKIRGHRFVRTLIRDQADKIIKDHWDNHGKV
ncbi:hypothetical protein [Persicitalea sp.]|uniref:hypothetical protein n=1 Tax=Persicitalea sp. TaxID=3100273 RepID=UPI00359385CC